MTIHELLSKKAELIAAAREIQQRVDEQQNGEWRGDDGAKFDDLMAKAEATQAQIERIARLEAAEKSTESQGRRSEQPPASGEPRLTFSASRQKFAPMDGLRAWLLPERYRTPELREAAQKFGYNLAANEIDVKLFGKNALRGQSSESLREWQEQETRAQGVATGGAGGFTVPDAPMAELEKAMLFFGGMRQAARIIRTDGGNALPFPMTNDTGQTGVILAENTQVALQDATFTQLVLDAYKYSSKAILVSVELLQDSAINVAEVLGQLLGERIGRIQNTHFTTGTGSGQPNGVVTASTVGVTGATGQTTSVTYNDLVDLLHSVDPVYRPNARWMFNDLTLRAIKKIKIPQFSGDTAGVPLWQPSLVLGQPDAILGYPYTINNDVATMAANAKSILFGDFSKYLIREVRGVTLLRLDERYADFHQVGFLAFARADGDLLNAGTNPVKHYANSAT